MVTYNKTSKTKEKTPVFYNPKNELREYKERCKFCTHWQYFDYQHLNEAGKPYPHDYPADYYLKPENVEHHGDHCPDLHGNIKQKIKYHFKRQELGWRDPYYNGSVAVRELEKRRKEQEAKNPIRINQEEPDQEVKPDRGYYIKPQADIRQSVENVPNPVTLLHKRVDKRKEEIRELRDIVFELCSMLKTHATSIVIPEEITNMMTKTGYNKTVSQNETLDKYVYTN